MAGGFTDGLGTTATSGVELYDPESETFTEVGTLGVARGDFNLVLSTTALLVAVGGTDTYGGHATTADVEAWDPIDRTFITLGETLPVPTTDVAAAAFGEGQVLVAGGVDDVGTVLGAAHVIDPTEDEVTATGNLATARRGAAAILLPTGEVLIVGGEDATGAPLSSLEIYDPDTGTFAASAAALSHARTDADVVALANGAIAIVGGVVDASGHASKWIEVYDPTTDQMISDYEMAKPRTGAAVVPLDDGRLMVAYGAEATTLPPANVASVSVFASGILGATIPAPRIVGVSPQPAARGIDVDTVIRARLSKPIDPATATGCFVVKDEEGNTLAGTVSTASDDKVLVFTADAPLGVRQVISVEVLASVQDRLGSALVDDSGRTWSFTTTWDMLIGAKDNQSQFGYCTRAGDVNGDGVDDLVISAYVAEKVPGSGTKEGQVYVIFGRKTWGPATPPTLRDLSSTAGAADLVITGETGGDQLTAPTGLGLADIDGDGYDDIVIGAHSADGPAEADKSMGEMYVVFGQSSFTSSSLQLGNGAVAGFNVLKVFGALAGDKFGESFAFGDVDGDGKIDIVTSGTGIDWDPSTTSTGGMVVIFGDTQANLGVSGGFASAQVGSSMSIVNLELLGEDASDRLAWCVACGDLDGDGYADVIGGATGGDGAGNTTSGSGDVLVMYGASRATLLGTGNTHVARRFGTSLGVPGFVIHGELKSDLTGWSVHAADLDGDGYDDLAMGSYLGDGLADAKSNAGDTTVFFGAPRPTYIPSGLWAQHTISPGLAGPTMLRIGGQDGGDFAGDDVLIADVDGDGNRDLLIGAIGGRSPQNTGGSNIGEIAIFRGALRPPSSPYEFEIGDATTMPGGVTLTRFYGRSPSDRWGTTLSVGDFNGDGYPDLLTGANIATGLGRLFTKAGEAYVLWGRSTWWK